MANAAARSEQTSAPGRPAGETLVITRVLDAPRDRVWSVWTSAEHLVHWWGPRDKAQRDFTTPVCEIDFRVGGAYRICIRSPAGQEMWQRGVYREIVADERLAFTFAWDSPGAPANETLIEVTFADADADADAGPGRTLLTFRQSGLETAASRDDHLVGWTDFVDRLEAFLRSGIL